MAPPGRRESALTPYIAALKKENLYYNNFVIPAGHMVPLSAETGGRFDATFCKFLKEVVTSGLDFGKVAQVALRRSLRWSLYNSSSESLCSLSCGCVYLRFLASAFNRHHHHQ